MKRKFLLIAMVSAVTAITTMSFKPPVNENTLVKARKCALDANGKPTLATAILPVTIAVTARLIVNAAVDAAVELSPEALTIFILGGDNSSKSVRNVSSQKYVDEMTAIKLHELDPK